MKVYSAVILSEHSEATDNIEAELRLGGFSDIKTMSYISFLRHHSSIAPDLIISTRSEINFLEAQRLVMVASSLKQFKFLVLVRQPSLLACRRLSEIQNIATLQIPCETAVFQKAIKEIVNKPLGRNLIGSSRFQTDEPVRMIAMDTGLLIQTRMKNFSGTGAFLEYRGISLKVGSRLSINFVDQEGVGNNKGLKLNGRVVWVQHKGSDQAPLKGIGIEFSPATI
jgi:hypothetical protein